MSDGATKRIGGDQIRPTRETISGFVGWGVALAMAHRLGSIILSLILVRLIAPEAYGQFGLANAILLFAMTLSLQRFMEHTFHQDSVSDQKYAEHLAFGVYLHLGLFLILNGAMFFGSLPQAYQEIKYFVVIGSFAILLNVPRIFYSTHLRRVLDWRRIRSLHLTSFFLSAGVSLTLALSGHGVLALLSQNLAVPLPYIADMLLRRRDLFAIKFRLAEYRAPLMFGAARSSGAVLQLGRNLIESSIVTAQTGFASFGVWGRALGLGALASGWISEQVHGIMYPVLARLSPRTAQARRAAALMLRLALWSSAPLGAALVVFNDTAVWLLYGPNWSAVAPLLPPVIGLTVLGTVQRSLGLVLLITEGARASLVLDLLALLLCVVGLLLVLDDGLLSYAWFLFVGNALALTALSLFLVSREALGARDLVMATLPIAVISLAMVFALQSEALSALDAKHSLGALIGSVAFFSVCALGVVRAFDVEGLSVACGYLPGGASLARFLMIAQDGEGGAGAVGDQPVRSDDVR